MKEITKELYFRFDNLYWCDDIRFSTSILIDELIKDGFFISNLSNGLNVHLE